MEMEQVTRFPGVSFYNITKKEELNFSHKYTWINDAK